MPSAADGAGLRLVDRHGSGRVLGKAGQWPDARGVDGACYGRGYPRTHGNPLRRRTRPWGRVLGEVYIADAWRTPFCRAGGALARSSPQALAVAVVRAFTDRGFASDSVDEIILGNVLNGRGNLARYAALGA